MGHADGLIHQTQQDKLKQTHRSHAVLLPARRFPADGCAAQVAQLVHSPQQLAGKDPEPIWSRRPGERVALGGCPAVATGTRKPRKTGVHAPSDWSGGCPSRPPRTQEPLG